MSSTRSRAPRAAGRLARARRVDRRALPDDDALEGARDASTTRRRTSTSGTTSARSRWWCWCCQIVTGIFLTMNYKPSAAEAFALGRIHHARRRVGLADPLHALDRRLGVLHRRLPAHVPRACCTARTRSRASCVWIFGMLIYLCLMAEAFLGYLLPWGNMSYWGAQVIVSLFGAIPCIGDGARRMDPRRLLHLRRHAEPLLRAARGRAAAGAVFLVVAHILALHEVGSNNPDGIEIKKVKGPDGHPARRHPVPSVLHGARTWSASASS